MSNLSPGKVYINRKTCFYILIMWVFFGPGYFSIFSGLKSAINISSYAISIVFIIISLVGLKTKPSIQLVLIGLFYLELVIVTAFSDGSLMSAIAYSVPVFALCFFYETRKTISKIRMIQALFWIHFVFTVINLITVIAFPDGFYTYEGASTIEAYYFLGHNNVAGRFMLPGVVYAVLCDYLSNDRLGWKSYIMAIISFITVCLTWSNTAMVGLGILLLYLLLQSKFELPKFITLKWCLLGTFILFVFLVILNNVSIFQTIIVNVFNKDMTFSNRTVIWDAVLINISNRPLFGYGYDVGVWEYASMGNLQPSSAHNYILDLLFRGGIVHLILQVLIVLRAGSSLEKNNNWLSRIIVVAFISYFVMWEFEPFVNSGFRDMMLLFLIASDLNSIEEYAGKVGHKAKVKLL